MQRDPVYFWLVTVGSILLGTFLGGYLALGVAFHGPLPPTLAADLTTSLAADYSADPALLALAPVNPIILLDVARDALPPVTRTPLSRPTLDVPLPTVVVLLPTQPTPPTPSATHFPAATPTRTPGQSQPSPSAGWPAATAASTPTSPAIPVITVTPTPTSSATPTPSSSVEPTGTATPVATATPLPVFSPTPTATPAPSPTNTRQAVEKSPTPIVILPPTPTSTPIVIVPPTPTRTPIVIIPPSPTRTPIVIVTPTPGHRP